MENALLDITDYIKNTISHNKYSKHLITLNTAIYFLLYATFTKIDAINEISKLLCGLSKLAKEYDKIHLKNEKKLEPLIDNLMYSYAKQQKCFDEDFVNKMGELLCFIDIALNARNTIEKLAQ